MTENRVVIVGAGQAGQNAAVYLRQGGFDGPIVLIERESGSPYQRPPLSKARLLDPNFAVNLAADSFYRSNNIELRSGDPVVAINAGKKQVRFESRSTLTYDHLIIAIGCVPRRPSIPGIGAEGIRFLKTLEDSDALGANLRSADKVVVIGGGFIGLEVAAAARAHYGRNVTVLEAQTQVMPRVVSQITSEYFCELHRENGVEIRLSQTAAQFMTTDGSVRGVKTTSGEFIEGSLIVVGIGAIPETRLAEEAGLDVSNGIVVDEYLQTSDPSISAIGDCAAFPFGMSRNHIRLESVQNAVDHAKCVADRLNGKAHPYESLPWFWTEQFGQKLQIAGYTAGYDETVIYGHPSSGRFSVLCFSEGKLIGAESINRPSDHVAVRRLLTSGGFLTLEEARDPRFSITEVTNKKPVFL